jgi:hypothetical protein
MNPGKTPPIRPRQVARVPDPLFPRLALLAPILEGRNEGSLEERFLQGSAFPSSFSQF